MTSPTGSDLLERARAWAAEDPDDQTRAELEAVLAAAGSGDEAATADLADRFAGTLEFGTAGLRGALGAGPNRMNRIVVIRAAGHVRARTDRAALPAGGGQHEGGPQGGLLEGRPVVRSPRPALTAHP